VQYRDDDGDRAVGADYWCEDERRYVQIGALRAATLSAEE
jgi:hypothetical protein